MAYSLKTSGLATELVMCVAVDSDGTIKEFVSPTVNANKTLGTGVAASVGTGSWQGTARKYWSSTNNGGFDYFGVKFPTGNRPTLALNNANGWTLWEAYHAVSTPNNSGGFISYSSSGDGGVAGTYQVSNKLVHLMSSSNRGTGTTTLPNNNSTKFSAGVTFKDSVGQGETYYYGLDGGSLASDGTSTSGVGNASSNGEVYGIGGLAGVGSHPASRYCSLLFNRQLTLTEMQSLHNDWFNTLFDAPASSDITGAGAIATAEAFGTATVSSNTIASITSVGAISSGQAFGTATVSPPAGVVVIQPVNNTGTALNGVTFDVAVLHATTLANVAVATGITASGGNLTITHASMVAGTTYNFLVRRTDTGKLGCITATAT